ncbi:MAG: hypothetical protein GWN73_06520, partial [Actinobacteria bacterium]|nr:hypothetical protein [Actinomycetota bacterium]NIU65096.1 hypothetical protein [Actinomycetota bacterium]NIW26900.1 hypothetical protein [Actinomycetota bacterium]
CLVACGDDGTGSDAAADTSTTDGEVMCIALGMECDGTVPCCAPNGCAGGMCGAPRADGGGDAATGDAATGDAATCADFDESCATLPCCEPTAQCVAGTMTCQPGEG